MGVEKVVKVMNFHSLLRVDKSKKIAEMYFNTEQELHHMMAKIVYNKNLILDKKMLLTSENAPVLNIYIGNDFGFCGNFNSQINHAILEDKDADKIFIGKKIYIHEDKILLSIDKDLFEEQFYKIKDLIYSAVNERRYSEINIIYNHYNSINNIQFIRKRVFPVEIQDKEEVNYNEDFVVETDVHNMLTQMIALYLCYEIIISFKNSNASENVMRQLITKESLKKIEEINAEKNRIERKEKKYKSFQKSIEDSIKFSQEEGDL